MCVMMTFSATSPTIRATRAVRRKRQRQKKKKKDEEDDEDDKEDCPWERGEEVDNDDDDDGDSAWRPPVFQHKKGKSKSKPAQRPKTSSKAKTSATRMEPPLHIPHNSRYKSVFHPQKKPRRVVVEDEDEDEEDNVAKDVDVAEVQDEAPATHTQQGAVVFGPKTRPELVEVGRGGATPPTTPLAKQKPKRKQPEDGATPNYSDNRYDWF